MAGTNCFSVSLGDVRGANVMVGETTELGGVKHANIIPGVII